MMHVSIYHIGLLVSLIFYGQLSATDIKGTIKYEEKHIRNAAIKMNSDPVCVKLNAGRKVYDENVVVADTGGLENVFVYIKEGAPPASSGALPTR